MLRAVMAVTLATAILATSLPALDAARREHTASTVRADLDRLETAVADLQAREGAVPPGTAGARRVVTVHLPARSWTHAGVAYVSIGGSPREPAASEQTETAIAWQLPDGPLHQRWMAGTAVAAGGADGADEPLVLRESGAHRLAVTLVERGDRRVVVVGRVD